MKFKIVTLTIMASVLIAATVAMANNAIFEANFEIPTDFEIATDFDFISDSEIATEDTFETEIDRLAKYMGYDTDEKFDRFHKTVLFLGRRCPTEESFDYLEQMILDGCDAQTVMDIYQFYLTTNEDISIVRQIYDMVWNGEPIVNKDIAFETAFNELTDNKCGVLTEEDIKYYLEQGLTVNDISEANRLCRKGVMTIKQILDSLLAGTQWQTITARITDDEAVEAYSGTDKTQKINQLLMKKGYWRAKKSKNFEHIAATAAKKGVSREKLTELMNHGYSESDLINAMNDSNFSAKTVDIIVERVAVK